MVFQFLFSRERGGTQDSPLSIPFQIVVIEGVLCAMWQIPKYILRQSLAAWFRSPIFPRGGSVGLSLGSAFHLTFFRLAKAMAWVWLWFLACLGLVLLSSARCRRFLLLVAPLFTPLHFADFHPNFRRHWEKKIVKVTFGSIFGKVLSLVYITFSAKHFMTITCWEL